MTGRQDTHRAEQIGKAYDRYAVGLYRYALMLLSDHRGAEDAVQQVFAACLRRSGAIDHELAYLRTAVRNECFSMLRRRTRETPQNDLLLERVDSTVPDLDQQMAIEAALRTLSPEQREVVHLKVFEGLTFQEIAHATGESINTAASRYRYAIAKMRVHLQKVR
jgi:RNA polymerase sigma-70 factor (ECF subfamily)